MKKIIWVGDSTVAFNGIETYPQTGIGQEFDRYVRREYVVIDLAKNGASSRSFWEEGRFKAAEELMEKGDYLFIQFGHNDEKEDKERHTDPYTTYHEYLLRYIRAAEQKGAIPLLITSLSRRQFKEDGTISNSHGEYPAAMKALGEKEKVAVVDLTEKSRILLEKTGDLDSRRWFMYFPAGIYENYPEERKDNSHLSYEGAVKMAGLIAEGIKEIGGVYLKMLPASKEMREAMEAEQAEQKKQGRYEV